MLNRIFITLSNPFLLNRNNENREEVCDLSSSLPLPMYKVISDKPQLIRETPGDDSRYLIAISSISRNLSVTFHRLHDLLTTLSSLFLIALSPLYHHCFLIDFLPLSPIVRITFSPLCP
jgi:hypothetical protein